MDPVREATGKTRERLAPHAAHAKEAAVLYAGAARDRAIVTTRERVVPALVHAMDSAAPHVEHAMETARHRVRHDVVPRVYLVVDQARIAAEPVRDEALSRAGAALAVIKGEVTADEIAEVTRKRKRRGQRRKLLTLTLAAGAGYAAWTWWRRRNAQPEWLTDEPDPTLQGAATTPQPAQSLDNEVKPEDEFRSTTPGKKPKTD
ncbi:DUF5324 family protein [Embleya sp. NBC_00896]|uniref:DUF5324 family protein n=1 Tax=Embleya sp. NBC_00896 TaxID=2975961 RepID=UPI003865C77C|nr:DUF5324 family protein [Embleya sp. NBC_00896]